MRTPAVPPPDEAGGCSWRRRRRRLPPPGGGGGSAGDELGMESEAGAAAPAQAEGCWTPGGGRREHWCQEAQDRPVRPPRLRPPRLRLSVRLDQRRLLRLPLVLAAAWLLVLLSLAGRGQAFNLLPKLPSFRHHLFFHPATPAPAEGGTALSTTNLDGAGGGSSSGGGGGDDPTRLGASGGLGGTLVDVARRRLWRWTVWRRLYHSSVVTVLKQSSPATYLLPGFVRRRPRLDSTYTKPTPFLFSPPDAGLVTVASSATFNSVHLVTRAAAPEQKSLIYVNGTEVSGHLRGSAVAMPSPLEAEAVGAGAAAAIPIPPPTAAAGTAAGSPPLSLNLLGEFCIDKPAYLHIAPTRAGATPLLWVTQFSITRKGSVSGINIFGGGQQQQQQPQTQQPQQPQAPQAQAQEQPPVEMKLGYPFRWPNEVYNLPPGTVAGAADEALLVADGFLMPGRSDGGLYVVQDPGKPSERVTALTRHRPGWFYHKAVWVDLMGRGGRPCLLTARATKPFFAQTEGELVLLLQPEGPFPLAEWNTPWDEIVLAKGPDVMFEVADLDPDDDVIEVFAAEFFSRRLTLHRIRRGDARAGRRPRVLTSEVLDDALGPAYSVVLADLEGKGRPTHVLVSSHECQYEGLAGVDEVGGGGGGGGMPEAVTAAAALTGVEEPRGPGLQGSSSSSVAARAEARARARARAASAEDEDSSPGDYEEEPELRGGSLFAYEIPQGWRERVPWKRSVVATGFHVRTWGQINPGAPGFPYVFYPHASMARLPGQRPYILLAGDCSHAAYIYRPVGSGDDGVRYEPMVQINCGGTVGSLAVGYEPLFGKQQPQQAGPTPAPAGDGDGDGGSGSGDGWAKIFVPNFDTDKIYAFAFGPERSLGISPSEPPSVPSETHQQLQAAAAARAAEEDEVLSAVGTYGKARGDKTKLS